MSLLVWLPLNGNLKNKGCADVSISVSGTTSYTDGKIGQALSCNGSTFWNISSITLGSSASIAYWSKTSTNNKMVWVLESAASNKLNIYESGKYTLNTGDGTANPYRDTTNSDVACLHDNLWHHFVITFGSNESLLYIDGNYAGKALTFRNPTTTNGKIKLAGGYNNAHTYDWNGQINDFRVYNHCLSPVEVKEIAKGLILHYSLSINKPEIVNGDNLLLGSSMSGKYLDSFVVNSSTDWTKYLRYYNGNASLHTFSNGTDTISLNGSGNLGISFVRKAIDIELDPNSYYTISCKAKCTKITNLCIGLSYYTTSNSWIWRGGTNAKAFNATNTWQTFSLTFKPDNNTQYINYCFTVVGSSGSTDTYSIKECKLEKGNIATDWKPSVDEKYSASDIICDSSGYGNNGIFNGTLNYNLDTPRYTNCISFNNHAFIAAGSSAKIKDDISICCWAYMNDWTNATTQTIYSCTEVGGWSFNTNPSNGCLIVYMGTGTTTNTYKLIYSIKTLNDLNTGWHHFVITYNGLSVKLYIDGVLDSTNDAYTTKTPIFYNSNNGIFLAAEAYNNTTTPAGTTYFVGNLSDFRIYATALSADDVLQLYNIGAKIDNMKNLHCYEIHEYDTTGTTKLLKTGVFKAVEFNEVDNSMEIKEDGNVDSNKIIEI